MSLICCAWGCKNLTEERRMAQCNICNQYYIHPCVESSTTDVRTIKTKVPFSPEFITRDLVSVRAYLELEGKHHEIEIASCYFNGHVSPPQTAEACEALSAHCQN